MAVPELTDEIKALVSLTPCYTIWGGARWVVVNITDGSKNAGETRVLAREASYEQWQAVLTELMT